MGTVGTKIIYVVRLPFLFLIRLYQKTISFDHGPMKIFWPHGFCRFHPSCSEYGYQAIKKYGLVRGVPKTIWRILRCNPWSKGGMDLPQSIKIATRYTFRNRYSRFQRRLSLRAHKKSLDTMSRDQAFFVREFAQGKSAGYFLI